MDHALRGRCPACGEHTLTVNTSTAYGTVGQPWSLRCDNTGCPDRLAASKVLDLDHRHVVRWGIPLHVTDPHFSLEHPVTCRLDGKRLYDCPVHKALFAAGREAAGTPDGTGYYVELDDESPWGFTTQEIPNDV